MVVRYASFSAILLRINPISAIYILQMYFGFEPIHNILRYTYEVQFYKNDLITIDMVRAFHPVSFYLIMRLICSKNLLRFFLCLIFEQPMYVAMVFVEIIWRMSMISFIATVLMPLENSTFYLC